jgi:polyketide biosynthesis acyl carrier protein
MVTKQEVIQVIKNNIVDNLDDIEEGSIDVSKSMKDYGANSLDIIEVVSSSMRELSIKIPRSELADITTIDELADRFMQYVNRPPEATSGSSN